MNLGQVHVLQYAVLGWLVAWTIPRTLPWVCGGLFGLSAVGWLDELLQRFVPGRYFDWADIWWNMLGGGAGLIGGLMAKWLIDVIRSRAFARHPERLRQSPVVLQHGRVG